MKSNVIIGTLLCPIWIALCSWGFLVHRTIGQLSVYQLPHDLRTFFYQNMDSLVKNSVRADLRRSQDSTEDAKHFINFESFGDSAAWKMPARWEDAVRIYSKDSLLRRGYLPYHIIAMKNRLTNAFRMKNGDSILFYAADLAHYIADAHVPLHTTTNYDGQLTGQKGLHSLWESMIPEIELDQYDLRTSHKANYLKHPEKSIWQSLRTAHELIAPLLEYEKETSKLFVDSAKYRYQVRRGKEVRSYSSAFARAYSKKLGSTINRQLINSSKLIADFWYTCWIDGGRPDVHQFTDAVTAQQKKTLKMECRAFKANNLVDKKLLLARRAVSVSDQ